MAAVSLLSNLQDTTNSATYTTGSFTPTAGSLIVVCCYGKTTVTNPPTCTGSANSLTFTSVKSHLGDGSLSCGTIFIADQVTPGSPASMTITVDYGGDAAVGASVVVLESTGMSKTGATAALQVAGATDNLTASSTPTITFGAACQSGNPTIAFFGCNTNPAGLTVPTGYTMDVDSGYSTPSVGNQVVHKNSSGSTTITWNGGTVSRGICLGVELDTSSSGSAFSFTPTDNVVPTDIPNFAVGKNFTDDVVPTDIPNFAVGKNFTDNVVPTDIPNFAVGKNFTDNVVPTDIPDFAVGKSFGSDNAGPTDSGLLGFAVDKAFTDDAGVSDSVVFQLGGSTAYDFTPTDNVNPIDSALMSVGKIITDVSGSTDAAVMALGKNITDNVVPTDLTALAIGKNVLDLITLTDTFSFILSTPLTQSRVDDIRLWLTGLGYSGSLPDMQYAFLVDRYTASFGAPARPLTAGDIMVAFGKPVRRFLTQSDWP